MQCRTDISTSRRNLSRPIIVFAVLLMLVFIACSSVEPSPTPAPEPSPTTTPPTPTATTVPTATVAPQTEADPGGGLQEPEQGWIVRSDDEEVDIILATPDLAVGKRRFAMVLTDKSGIVAFPIVRLMSYRYPDGPESLQNREGPIENATARYYPFPYGTRGIHVTELTFDQVGTWGVEVNVPRPDGNVATVEVITEVREQTMSVDVGEIPPLSDSRTLDDVSDVSELTTGYSRDESLYQISIADALTNDKPTVVVFASPAFCTNAVCGPQVEVLSNLSKTYAGEADFIHIDLFTNPWEILGDLSRAIPTPLLDEWGLVSQEWTFVMDDDGKVVGRFENFVPQDELEPAILSIIVTENENNQSKSVP